MAEWTAEGRSSGLHTSTGAKQAAIDDAKARLTAASYRPLRILTYTATRAGSSWAGYARVVGQK